MLSVDFLGEVMRRNIAFGEACELLSEPQFFGAQLGNISPEFLATQACDRKRSAQSCSTSKLSFGA